MNRINLEYPGTAKWFEFVGCDVNRPHETTPTSMLEAVRFVMEQLPPSIRGSAWIDTDAGSLGIGDIQALRHLLPPSRPPVSPTPSPPSIIYDIVDEQTAYRWIK